MFNRKSKNTRESITRERLQEAIAAAVKTADESCASFVGVFVEQVTRKSPGEANWAIKGIRFGRADRDRASAALATVVEQMQREFELQNNDGAKKTA
jgi:hypothetical protein